MKAPEFFIEHAGMFDCPVGFFFSAFMHPDYLFSLQNEN